MNGQEVKEKLRLEGVSLSELAAKMGLSSQALSNRMTRKHFKPEYLEEINSALGKNIFPVGQEFSKLNACIPIYNVRICAGNGVGIGDDEPAEYINIPRLKDCIGGYVYGESMRGMFNSGDLLIMREITDKSLLNYGRPYVLNITEIGAVVKLIYSSRKGDDYIRLVAYNQDKYENGDRMFPDMEIKRRDVLKWFRIIERHETIA